MPIHPNFYQTLLPCPIVELRGYLAACGLKGRLYAYLDFNGPTGTSRDGLAEGMLALAAEQHALAPGQPIIEASSGAFAVALTLASRTAGHPIVLTMRPRPAAGVSAPPWGPDPPLSGPERAGRSAGAGRDQGRRKRLVLHELAGQR